MAEIIAEDQNNNSLGKRDERSYSLRPRCFIKKTDSDEENSETFAEVAETKKPRGRRRSKNKPAPLSRYRRKTANARERCRMREINDAFDSLRRAVPHSAALDGGEKLTKISTLRLAMSYITALTAALTDPSPPLSPDSFLPPTPPVSDSPLSPPSDLSPFTDLKDFDPFTDSQIDLDELFFT